MKTALALGLVLILIASSVPVAATGGIDSTTGPISLTMAREASRLAAESAASSGQPGEEVTDSGWSRVRKLEPGTEVIVSTIGSQPVRRYVLWADEAGISVLNLTDADLSADVALVLQETAGNHPEYFAAAQSEEFVLRKNIRLKPDGVFVADHKVAALGRIVQYIGRSQVVELRLLHDHSIAKSVGFGLVIGLGAGLLVGRLNDCSPCDSAGLVTFATTIWGLGLGAAGGLVVGSIKASRHGGVTGLIYRVP